MLAACLCWRLTHDAATLERRRARRLERLVESRVVLLVAQLDQVPCSAPRHWLLHVSTMFRAALEVPHTAM